MNEVECPYCEEYYDFDFDREYEDGKTIEDTCPNCDKNILVMPSCSWSFEAEKADCLNGAEHPFEDWHTYWIGERDEHEGEFYERRYCNGCDKDEYEWHAVRLGTNSPDRFDKN